MGESHLQHPLLAITGWALPAARGALTAGNGLESNSEGWLWIPFGVNFGAACKSGVHTGGYLVDERDQLFFTGNATTAGKGAASAKYRPVPSPL